MTREQLFTVHAKILELANKHFSGAQVSERDLLLGTLLTDLGAIVLEVIIKGGAPDDHSRA